MLFLPRAAACGRARLAVGLSAPVTLSLALGAAALLALPALGVVPAASLQRQLAAVPLRYMSPLREPAACAARLLLYPLVHRDASHYLGNFASILLAGPPLEGRLGSARLLALILLTTLATGVANALLFDSGLIGASGIALLLLLLLAGSELRAQQLPVAAVVAAAPTARRGGSSGGGGDGQGERVVVLPLTLLLLLGIHVGREGAGAVWGEAGVSRFAHIIGLTVGAGAVLAGW